MELRTLMREGGCGHVIFEGQPTVIWAILRDAFGPDRIQGETEGKIEVNIKQSPQHIEVNRSELKGYEKHVILELMKETRNVISKKHTPCGLNIVKQLFYTR
ncbi:uncharacterized protein LOC136066960 isoform X4 [Quercus suber]|uniref:uncharacterized protein LOC136066960 isoform X4 n=1 Tax=Quercus suber TaxID=58331 RepID=UPI0032DF4ABF